MMLLVEGDVTPTPCIAWVLMAKSQMSSQVNVSYVFFSEWATGGGKLRKLSTKPMIRLFDFPPTQLPFLLSQASHLQEMEGKLFLLYRLFPFCKGGVTAKKS